MLTQYNIQPFTYSYNLLRNLIILLELNHTLNDIVHAICRQMIWCHTFDKKFPSPDNNNNNDTNKSPSYSQKLFVFRQLKDIIELFLDMLRKKNIFNELLNSIGEFI